MKFHVSTVCSAFGVGPIGTKVLWPGSFRGILETALASHDPSKDRVVGQHYIVLPPEAIEVVSSGVARRVRVSGPEGYVVRRHRGRYDMFARREYAEPATGVAAVVYTRAAYLADPDYSPEEEIPEDATHVIVAVLAFAGPKPELSPYRFVANLSGGNHEAETYTADEIRTLAQGVMAYDDEWITVAD